MTANDKVALQRGSTLEIVLDPSYTESYGQVWMNLHFFKALNGFAFGKLPIGGC
jgi:hypothetical protein